MVTARDGPRTRRLYWRRVNRLQVRAAIVPAPITWTIMLSACALGAYWWISYSGLYRLLSEFQLDHFDRRYYPSYTGAIVLVLCLVPAAILVQVIGAIREKKRSPEEAVAARGNRLHFWLQYRRGRATTLGMTLMLLGAAVYFCGTGLLAGKRVPVDAGALEHGEPPAGRYAELTGLLLADDAVATSERNRASAEKIYIPVVSPEWQDGKPIRAYIEMDGDAPKRYTDELASRHYEGMLTANSLPGVVVSSLTGRGRAPSDRYWVLEYRQTPETKIFLGKFMLVAAAISGLITAIAWAVAARRERAAGDPSP
jgi:hypothetical protein